MENAAQNQGVVPQNQAVNQGAGEPQPQAVQPQVVTQPTNGSQNDRTTEQFNKLLESNRKLYEANEKLRSEFEARAAAQAAPQVQPVQPSTQVDARDFIERDPVSGEQYINEAKMKARIQEIEQRAERAENRVNSFVQSAEKQEQQRQERETFAAYPELEPGKDTFDANFHKQVRGVLYDSALFSSDYGGRALSFKEAADLVRGQNPLNKTTPVNGGNVPGGESAGNPGSVQKEQGSAQAVSEPQNAPRQTSSEELEQLRNQTRMGSDDALAMRLVAVDHVRKN